MQPPPPPRPAPAPPPKENTDDSTVAVLRDDKSGMEKIAVEGPARAHPFQTGADMASAKPRSRRRNPDDRLSVRDIAVTLAAVIVVSFGFTALLPSILTRDAIEPTVVAVAPAQQPQPVPPAVAVQSAGAPAPAQPAAARVSNPPAAAANTAPALRTGIVPQGKQAAGRATGASGTDLKGAQKTAAVAVAAPRRPAPARPSLTDEEKAAIERGLQALQKEAEQAQP